MAEANNTYLVLVHLHYHKRPNDLSPRQCAELLAKTKLMTHFRVSRNELTICDLLVTTNLRNTQTQKGDSSLVGNPNAVICMLIQLRTILYNNNSRMPPKTGAYKTNLYHGHPLRRLHSVGELRYKCIGCEF